MNNPSSSPLMVATVCPDCRAPIGTEYILIGAPEVCGNCGHTVIASTSNGTKLPVRQWEISFQDFDNLLTDQDYRGAIAPLLAQWFGYAIKSAGDIVKVFAPDGELVEPIDLHKRIQADPDHQYQLYQTAMSLWR